QISAMPELVEAVEAHDLPRIKALIDPMRSFSDATYITVGNEKVIEKLPNGIGFYVDASVKSGGVDGEQDKHLSDLVANAIELGV
ncbi:oligogalacturonate-specific porin KdgM family protein, partial [Salmonella enterica subsp. enterica serovar Montevideo]|nr:oligogalacturonate-specific porin KdgM family protein [Salmonella enterica subsp. enterica serovar Montevideo]